MSYQVFWSDDQFATRAGCHVVPFESYVDAVDFVASNDLPFFSGRIYRIYSWCISGSDLIKEVTVDG